MTNDKTTNEVLAIVTSFMMPANSARIAEWLIGQPCDVVIADNGPKSGKKLWPSGLLDVFRWTHNCGPPCRFTPAWALGNHYEWILLVDDDLLPTVDCVQRCLDAAGSLGFDFATLGQVGRRYHCEDGGWHYVKRNVRGPRPQWVDMTARLHFFRAVDAVHALTMRNDVERVRAPEDVHMSWQDDILLCQGVQRARGAPSVLVSGLVEKNLHGNRRTMSGMPGFVELRGRMIGCCYETGWKSLWRERQEGQRPW